MANLSQLKREKLLAFLETLKEQHSDDESLMAIGQIEKELKSKKYGLVWEEHEEAVDVQMKTHIPVFTEVKEREICTDEDGEYNFLLEGDNLHSLYLLEKTHKGKIDVIYIDPPYNTGKKDDFKYNDAFVVKEDTFRHSKWLSFMIERLKIAKNLLSEKGCIFISIDDNEMANLKLLCDEIFGYKNCLGIISNINNPKGRSDDKFIARAHEYILVYAKNSDFTTWFGFEPTEEIIVRYNKVDSNGKKYREIDLRKTGENDLREDRPNLFYYFYYNEKTKDFFPSSEDKNLLGYIKIMPLRADGKEGNWRWGLNTAKKQINELIPKFMPARKIWGVMQKDFLENRDLVKPTSQWNFKDVNSERGSEVFINLGFDKKAFPKPKPVGTILRCIQLCSHKSSIILDFFAGSGTTGQAVMELNQQDGGHRKFILCTNNENNICENVTYQRLKTVITGKRADGSSYSEGLPANLKYFKTDFVDKKSEDLSDELLEHIAEMIELEHGIKIDNQKYVVIMSEEEMDEFEKNITSYADLKAVFVNQDILLTAKQQKLLDSLNSYIIPNHYFDFELREAGELW